MIIDIDKIQPDQAEQVLKYFKQVLRETDYVAKKADEVKLTLQEEIEIIKNYLYSENSVMLSAIVEDKIVGMLTLTGGSRIRTKHTAVMGISVSKSYWNKGIGGQLIDAMIDWAERGQVIKKINLTVREDNDKAQHLYLKKGFVLEGYESMKHFTAGTYYGCHHMGLKL